MSWTHALLLAGTAAVSPCLYAQDPPPKPGSRPAAAPAGGDATVEDVLARPGRSPAAPFRAFVVVDGRAGLELDYPKYVDLGDKWLDWWSPHLEFTEIVLVEDLPESPFLSPRRDYLVHAVVVRPDAWPEEWAPGGKGRIWLVGPKGVSLGNYGLDETFAARARLEQCLRSWIGKDSAEIWEDIEASESCWRHAVRVIHEGSIQPTGAVEFPVGLGPVLATDPDAPGAPEAEVRLASLYLLAVQQDAELPAEGLRRLRACPLFEASDSLGLADLFYRLHAGDVAPEEFQEELLPRKKAARLSRLKALYQLRLRDPLIVDPVRRLIERTSSREWEERSLALRILAAHVEPGIWIEPPTLLHPDDLPRERDVMREESWRVRLAHADLLCAFGSREAVVRLIARLGAEEHERVLDGIEGALERLTGRRFGRAVAAWQRWYASLDDAWQPTLELPGGWVLPPAPGSGAGGARTRALAVGDEGLFGTDVQNVVFAVDVSGSMRDGLAREVETDLELQLTRMGEDVRIGLVLFNEEVHNGHGKAADPTLVPVDSSVARNLLRSYGAASKSGRTDLAAGIREAFRFADVEEILLVTDAYPTAGDPRSVPGLVQLVDDLNLTRRVRLSTVLMRVGEDYFTEDLGSRALPEPTPEQRLEWAARAERFVATKDFSLLHELSRYHDGRCRVGFGNQIWSRNGVRSEDR